MKIKEFLKVFEELDEDTEVVILRNWEYVVPIDVIKRGYYFPDSGDAMDKETFDEEQDELVLGDAEKENCVLLYTD